MPRYPGNASVIFWTNGPQVRLDAEGIPSISLPKPAETPFYMEAELNSPQVRLAPGESYAFDTDWFPTRGGKEFAGVTDAGVVIRALRATRAEGTGIKLTGSFGVFFSGRLVAHIYDRGGRLLDSVPLIAVDPLQLADIKKNLAAPAQAARLSVHVEDSMGIDHGSLGEAVVQPAEKAP